MQRLLATLAGGVLVLSACAPSVSQMLPEVEVLVAEERAAEEPPAPPEAEEVADLEEAETTETTGTEAPTDAGSAERAPASQPTSGPATQARTAECRPVTGGGDHVAQLVDVRVGTHQGFDRVVLELAPSAEGPEHFGMPRYEIGPLTLPITEAGSGHPVEVEGSQFVGIVLHGASGVEFVDADPGYVLTYDGPRELKPGFPVLVEAQQTGDFERTLSWAFGLARASCWEVQELVDPLRLVIDFPHS